jgi:hypothetical protein
VAAAEILEQSLNSLLHVVYKQKSTGHKWSGRAVTMFLCVSSVPSCDAVAEYANSCSSLRLACTFVRNRTSAWTGGAGRASDGGRKLARDTAGAVAAAAEALKGRGRRYTAANIPADRGASRTSSTRRT